jgi:glycosyltransferase involved in cell wall biosynthesis
MSAVMKTEQLARQNGPAAEVGRYVAEAPLRLSALQAAKAALERTVDAYRRTLKASRQANQVLQQMLDELLDSAVQLHRRELRAWKEVSAARAETARIKQETAYRLGAAITRRAGPRMTRAGATMALWREYADCLRNNEPGTLAAANSDLTSAIVAFPADKHIAYVPLTLNSQVIILPAESASRVVRITFLAPHSARATIEVVLRADRGLQHVQAVGGKKLAPDEQQAVCRLNVAVGAPIRLLDLRPSSGEVTFSVRRVRGTFGVLKLERAAGFPQGAQRSVSTQQRLLRPVASPLDAFSAEDLELKLWGGFSRYAIPELERLKASADAPIAEREAAAWYLTRWFMVEEDYCRALENIELSKQIVKRHRDRVILAEIQCLLRLRRYEQASAAITQALQRKVTLDLLLVRSTALRYLELARGAAQDDADAIQLAALNEVFTQGGLAPVEKRCKEAPLSLANIVAHAQPASVSQPQKLSVVIPAFNAAETIEWVLHSLLQQTWRNMEIIVVDDLSTDATCEIVERIAGSDSRVRLLRQSVNAGAYPARNAGMRQATGELLMVHDSDDWSHPQRIEMQIQALNANPEVVAVKSYWVRVSANLEILGAWIPRGSMFDLNFSSLICRRELLDAVGYWDEVAVSGDAEFYSRIRALYGEGAVLRLSKSCLLALSLTRENSLTRSKATHLRSLFYGLRWNYRDSYVFWHERLQRGQPTRFSSAARERTFPIPLGNRQSRGSKQHCDVVVVADFAAQGASLQTTLDYLAAARKAGRKIAAFHWRHYPLPSRTPLQAKFYEACLQLDIDILSPGDAVSADVVLFPAPAILQYRIDPLPDISAGQVVVVAVAAQGARARRRQFDPAVARAHLRSIFGTEGQWLNAAAAMHCLAPAAAGGGALP